MNTKIYLVIGLVLILSNGVLFHLYTENASKLEQTEKSLQKLNLEFDDYKEKLNTQIKEYNALNDKFSSIQTETNSITYKLKKDAAREHIVESKPGLVSKLINNSFKKFTDSVVEETK